MDENKMRILKMVQDGVITAENAMHLLEAIDKTELVESDDSRTIELMPEDYEPSEKSDEPGQGKKKRPRFLIIQVSEGGKKKVNVKIPLKLAKFAMRFIPKSAQAHMKAEGVEFDPKDLIAGLEECRCDEDLVNVVDDDKGETVRIFCS